MNRAQSESELCPSKRKKAGAGGCEVSFKPATRSFSPSSAKDISHFFFAAGDDGILNVKALESTGTRRKDNSRMNKVG